LTIRLPEIFPGLDLKRKLSTFLSAISRKISDVGNPLRTAASATRPHFFVVVKSTGKNLGDKFFPRLCRSDMTPI
jgi:hypothetical protein